MTFDLDLDLDLGLTIEQNKISDSYENYCILMLNSFGVAGGALAL